MFKGAGDTQAPHSIRPCIKSKRQAGLTWMPSKTFWTFHAASNSNDMDSKLFLGVVLVDYGREPRNR